jgi:hypothetical protein
VEPLLGPTGAGLAFSSTAAGAAASSSALIDSLTTFLAGAILHSTLVEKKLLFTEPTTPEVDASAAEQEVAAAAAAIAAGTGGEEGEEGDREGKENKERRRGERAWGFLEMALPDCAANG